MLMKGQVWRCQEFQCHQLYSWSLNALCEWPFSCPLLVPPHLPWGPSTDHWGQRTCSVGRYVLGWLLVFPFPLLSHSERLAFRNVVSTRCTHNSTQSITAHNHRKYRMSLQRACSRISPHTRHMSQRTHTHIAPRHTLPHILHSAPTTRCLGPAYTWASGVRGEGWLKKKNFLRLLCFPF